MSVSVDVSGGVNVAGGVTVANPPGSTFEVNLPQPLQADVTHVGPVGPISLAPATFDINIDKLPEIKIDIENIPHIRIGLDPLTINPVELDLKLTEIPSIRAHLPANFTVGLSLLGVELICVRLCGEAQVITEPFEPNPCEECGREPRDTVPRQGGGA
ncbi:MAG: hypothetical protein JO166_09135 [Deltaproteobacteria bacterium]|nr:hypothetical protein [Deltaproteobacteria bacterium]